ncbi:hypothetical protein EDB84DRAFT_1600407 [Lactarius hengduanensis]|nr:hypothetical protein EDB84DRAFT_1600407 [Lactarius hengduanensis]
MDSLDRIRELIQERAASLVSASRCPAPLVEQSLAHAAESDAVRSQAMRCRFCRSITHLEEDCEEADMYIHAGKCRRDVVGKIVLPSGARIPHNIIGGTLQDRLEEYYRPKVAQVSVPGIATRRQVSATATEAHGPALPSHSKIAQEAIEPTDDYQNPQTPILSDPEPCVVPTSIANTVSNPPESSASERTNALCGIPPSVKFFHAVSIDCIPRPASLAFKFSLASPSHPVSPSRAAPSGPSYESPK